MKGGEKMNEIIVGRHINGITINGLEYLLDEDGEIMKFKTENHAIAYMKKHGLDEDEIYSMSFIYTNESRECECHLCEKKDDCYIADRFQRHPKEHGGLGLCLKLRENEG